MIDFLLWKSGVQVPREVLVQIFFGLVKWSFINSFHRAADDRLTELADKRLCKMDLYQGMLKTCDLSQ